MPRARKPKFLVATGILRSDISPCDFGADAFLIKPVLPSELRAAAQRLLAVKA